jgi:hypothetical protein
MGIGVPMRFRYAFLVLALAPSVALAQIPLQGPASPELVINAPAGLVATISNFTQDVDNLPVPPYPLPDTSVSLLLGYSAFAYVDANGDSVSTGYLYEHGPVTANVALALTASGSPAFGCSDIANAAELAVNIALLSRSLPPRYLKGPTSS